MATANFSLPFLPTLTFLSFKSEKLKAGDEISIVYKTLFLLPAYLTACIVFNVLNHEVYLSSSTQLITSYSSLEWIYTYETKARLVSDIDPETEYYLKIFDNNSGIHGYYRVVGLQDDNYFFFYVP